MHDAELTRAVAAGDHEAFSALYDRFAAPLHDFCASVLRDGDEARDAVQDTFVLAWQRIGQLRDPTKLKSWLFAIARHEALRRLRPRRRGSDRVGGCSRASGRRARLAVRRHADRARHHPDDTLMRLLGLISF